MKKFLIQLPILLLAVGCNPVGNIEKGPGSLSKWDKATTGNLYGELTQCEEHCDWCHAVEVVCHESWDGDDECDCGCDFADSDCPVIEEEEEQQEEEAGGECTPDGNPCDFCHEGRTCLDSWLNDGDCDCDCHADFNDPDCPGNEEQEEEELPDDVPGGCVNDGNPCVWCHEGRTCHDSWNGDGECDCECANGFVDSDCPEVSEPENFYKMAFILLAHNPADVTTEMRDKIESIRHGFVSAFSEATRGLATMDTSNPLFIHYLPEGVTAPTAMAVAKEFYKAHPDDFHFLSIYTAFRSNRMYHMKVQNRIQGIGRDVFDYTAKYDSAGKLLGVNQLGSTHSSMYSTTNFPQYNGLLHETGHHWCCSVGDNFSKGGGGARLEILQQSIHLYRGLASPYRSGTAMCSDWWVASGDGTYHREMNSDDFRKYHPIMLYLMGLLPPAEYSDRHWIYNAGVIGVDFSGYGARTYKQVTVNDIIALEGPRIGP